MLCIVSFIIIAVGSHLWKTERKRKIIKKNAFIWSFTFPVPLAFPGGPHSSLNDFLVSLIWTWEILCISYREGLLKTPLPILLSWTYFNFSFIFEGQFLVNIKSPFDSLFLAVFWRCHTRLSAFQGCWWEASCWSNGKSLYMTDYFSAAVLKIISLSLTVWLRCVGGWHLWVYPIWNLFRFFDV